MKGMVDISGKKDVRREAVAEGRIKLSARSMEAIRNGTVKKGDALETARVAGILAVKNTPSIIPHCHPIPVQSVELDFDLNGEEITCRCSVTAVYKTGVEMEALTGVSAALLTIWDMVKYLEKDENGQYPTPLSQRHDSVQQKSLKRSLFVKMKMAPRSI